MKRIITALLLAVIMVASCVCVSYAFADPTVRYDEELGVYIGYNEEFGYEYLVGDFLLNMKLKWTDPRVEAVMTQLPEYTVIASDDHYYTFFYHIRLADATKHDEAYAILSAASDVFSKVYLNVICSLSEAPFTDSSIRVNINEDGRGSFIKTQYIRTPYYYSNYFEHWMGEFLLSSELEWDSDEIQTFAATLPEHTVAVIYRSEGNETKPPKNYYRLKLTDYAKHDEVYPLLQAAVGDVFSSAEIDVVCYLATVADPVLIDPTVRYDEELGVYIRTEYKGQEKIEHVYGEVLIGSSTNWDSPELQAVAAQLPEYTVEEVCSLEATETKPAYFLYSIKLADVRKHDEVLTELQNLNSETFYVSLNYIYYPTPLTPSKGDVNGDGTVSAADYILLKSVLCGKLQLSESGEAAADVNGNGNVDSGDYLMIKLHLRGKVYIE